MQIIRYVVDHLVVLGIMLVAPSECLLIQVGDVPEQSAGKKIILNEAYESLDLTLGKRMSLFTVPIADSISMVSRLHLINTW